MSRCDRQEMIKKVSLVSEQIYELIFLKENIMSMVGEQKMRMSDFMRELKKYLFKLDVKS